MTNVNLLLRAFRYVETLLNSDGLPEEFVNDLDKAYHSLSNVILQCVLDRTVIIVHKD